MFYFGGQCNIYDCCLYSFNKFSLYKFAGRSQEYFTSTRGERAEVKKHQDNLTLEGEHTMQKAAAVSLQGQRAQVVKYEDNLKMEGDFEGRAEQVAFARGDRVDVVRHKDNLVMEGSLETHRKEYATKGERAEVKRYQVSKQSSRALESKNNHKFQINVPQRILCLLQ